jgi:hypothetical protein
MTVKLMFTVTWTILNTLAYLVYWLFDECAQDITLMSLGRECKLAVVLTVAVVVRLLVFSTAPTPAANILECDGLRLDDTTWWSNSSLGDEDIFIVLMMKLAPPLWANFGLATRDEIVWVVDTWWWVEPPVCIVSPHWAIVAMEVLMPIDWVGCYSHSSFTGI